jgi:hypothetical protein
MRLSILIPSHRSNLEACARIVQACSWAGPDIEVIVRDNSGDDAKRGLLSQIRRDNCNIMLVDPCPGAENYAELLRLAQGEFVYILADDDCGFDRAITGLPALIERIAEDSSVIGITGTYVVEHSKGTSLVAYTGIDSNDVVARLTGYLGQHTVNALYYSPIRRQLLQQTFEFMRSLPFAFSFHDYINCLLYLLAGRYARLNRHLYLYDVGVWESPDSAQERDLSFYRAASLDPSINKLHWLLCAFEGAVLIRNAEVFAHYSPEQRQEMADRWFSTMFMRFKNSRRTAADSRFEREADTLCDKWRSATGRLSFPELLIDIGEFIALSSMANAERYLTFWHYFVAKGITAQSRSDAEEKNVARMGR